MHKQFGYNYFLKKQKKTILKKLSVINGLLLIAQISIGGLFFITPIAEIQAGHSTMCAQPVDIVLIMDRSGSMDYTSRCDWWQLKCVNPPSCSFGYNWVKNITYNQTQSWCNAKNQSAPHQSSYLAINPKKIVAAKQAADNFVGLMGTGDQSALVSYANTASMDKLLSNNHTNTQIAINSLATGGATNIGDAIKLGTGELLSARANPPANKVMILLTDGLANKPNGPGYGEYPADVAYAESQAALAAGYGFKIFTIGLGANGEINETMLGNIASTTGGQYYHAPTQNDLQAIYNSIATRLCRYGSISGCKYSDVNKDGVILGEEKIAGWEIVLNNNDSLTQLTDASGCFKFTGLLPGGYTLSENGKAGVIFVQTYPVSNFYAINLAEGANLENYDFGNYLPVCGNHILDSAYGEVCEIGDSHSCATALGYAGYRNCLANCSGWSDCIPTEYCGDGTKNGNEQCDDGNQINTDGCLNNCTLPTCGDGVKNGTEECDGDMPRPCTSPQGYAGIQTCDSCVWSQCQGGSCGDGIKNGTEECDDGNQIDTDECKNDCTLPGCKSDVDVMMVLDRSGSMSYTSGCDWWQLKCVNPPSCSSGYTWVQNITYNQTQSWCNAKNQSAPHQSVWLNIDPVKIVAAKLAANNFIGLMGVHDQSGLVSYANNATLDKLLSNNHGATQTAVNGLITGGATDIGDAIKLGTQELLSGRANPQANKIMILLTDGLANKPFGSGSGENPADVAYAESMAALASAAGIKIYTIGLGNDGDINEIMLQNIASGSGGQYYRAPTASQLQEIFEQIAEDSCPDDVCGNGIIEPGEECDDGANNGQYGYCQSDCTGQTPAVCGNGVKEGTEECDGQAGVIDIHHSCTANCTLEYIPYCGDSQVNQLSEQCDDGNTQNGDGCDSTCQIETTGIQPGQVVINELMWPGTSGSIADEWLELRNLTTGQLDLSGCQLTKKSSGIETLMLTIPAGKTIASNSYFVISNYDKDHSYLNIDPNLVETDVSLANSDLQIKLYCGGAWNSGGTLIDTADDGSGAPLAGFNGIPPIPKKSMQRKLIPGDGALENNWCTASTQVNWDDNVTDLGTPGALNDCNGG